MGSGHGLGGTWWVGRVSSAALVAMSVVGCGDPVASGDGGATDAAVATIDAPTDDAVVVDAFVPPPPEVETSLGRVIGVNESGAQSFYGIPFAQPPVGDLRWRSPVAHGPWAEPLDASAPRSGCPQDALGLAQSGAEDCLFLNVHVPDPRPTNAPVMVWIHGGAFVFGEGVAIDRSTRGDLIAAREGAIVVSMNYRLGPFGFFADESMGARGNAGFEDQQLALRWVHDHIASFGGNPEDVTIVGESAGGISVCLHLISPGSRGLFHAAISQSGLCDSPLPVATDRRTIADQFIMTLGCTGAADLAACMRGKTMEEVRAANDTSNIFSSASQRVRPWWPYVDSERAADAVLPGQFRERVEAGESGDVPVIIGWNADEGTLFIDLAARGGQVIDETLYHEATIELAEGVGQTQAAMEALYPLANYATPALALAAMVGDSQLACPSRRAARLLAANGHAVRVYHFEYTDAPFVLPMQPGGIPLGAYHSAEIQYVFGRSSRIGQGTRFNDVERSILETMQPAWGRFVRTGDPSSAELTWPLYDVTEDRHLIIDRTISVGTGADRETCEVWRQGRTP